MSNLGFNVSDEDIDQAPGAAQPIILVSAENALIENICLYNPYGGIYLNGSAQAVIRRIFGQPLWYGIMVDGSRDTNDIDGIDSWTYWSPGTLAVASWKLANGTAICLARRDDPVISNVMAYNYNKGLSLVASPAASSTRSTERDADFDGCATGVHIDAPGTAGPAATIQMANLTIQSPTRGGVPTGNGIWVAVGSAPPWRRRRMCASPVPGRALSGSTPTMPGLMARRLARELARQ